MKRLFPFLFLSILFSCKHDEGDVMPFTGYPDDVAKILYTKCATEGCHNSASRFTAAGLDFSSWDVMFDGGKNGTSVIPYSTDYSFMLYTVNTDTNKGPVLLPTMPYLQSPLSNDEYQTLYNWIANGAPNVDGYVKFSDDPNRKKIYICMQGCDEVAVVDAGSKVIMRYISVGVIPGSIEGPHQVRVSPDGNYWYVVLYNGSVLQKFSTADDHLIGSVSLDIQSHPWNTLIFTPDGKKGFVNALDGRTDIVDLENMIFESYITKDTPHGGFVTPDGLYLYLTCQNGNFVYKIHLDSAPFYDVEDKIVLVPGQSISSSNGPQPHECALSPDGSKYFVSCQLTAEVRVFQTSNDSLLAVIPVGTKPQEFAFSEVNPYVFVTCTEDPISATQKGSVYVINYNDLSIVSGSPIYAGYQPHGIAVDDQEGLVYVANLNYDPNAPAPHHVTECGGRNGYLTIIDMNSLQLYNKTLSDGNSFQYKNELLAFPYFVSIRK